MINLAERLKIMQIETDELRRLLEMVIENIPSNGINQHTYSDLSKQLNKVFNNTTKQRNRLLKLNK